MSERDDAIAGLGLHFPEMVGFWQALSAGRFLIRRCHGCGETHWYPRAICPFCTSADTFWDDGSGSGTIYSYTIMRRTRTPYAVAFVKLAEGPIMMSNIVDADFDDIRIGRAVVLAIKEHKSGLPIPAFTLAKEDV